MTPEREEIAGSGSVWKLSHYPIAVVGLESVALIPVTPASFAGIIIIP